MAERGIVWERFQWTCAGVRYTFEVQSGGLHGRIRSDAGHALTLPIVAWEGLLDCVRTQRKARTQAAAVDLPPRAGARWSRVESDELSEGYKTGKSIAALAAHHARTRGAIQNELERMGLIVSPYALVAQPAAAFSAFDGNADAPAPRSADQQTREEAQRR